VGIFAGGLLATNTTYLRHISAENMSYAVEDSALVEYVAKFNKEDSLDIVSATIKWSKEFKLDPKFILAIQQTESSFDKYAISNAGALGLMQVIPRWHLDKVKTAKEVVGSPELFAIETNVYLGVRVIKDCLTKHKFEDEALRCYNGSQGMVTNYDKKVHAAYASIKTFVKG
jgi:soluble lytic murein transglycosylase-like protein